MAHLNVPATRNALCGLGISAQKRPARFRYLLSPAQNGDPAHRRSTSHSHEAIQQYKSMDADSPYLFPILSGNRESKEEYIEYQHALRKLNYDLKQLAVYCSIKFNVSSYTARHTWATLAKYCHFSEQLICDALGHSSTKVTETYLKGFKNDELNKANKVIIRDIQ